METSSNSLLDFYSEEFMDGFYRVEEDGCYIAVVEGIPSRIYPSLESMEDVGDKW